MERCERATVRYASGAVEHWYRTKLPKVGDRLGRNDEAGFVTSVEMESPADAVILVGTIAPADVTWDDIAPAERGAGETASARERILVAAYDLFSDRGVRAVGTEEVLEAAGVAKSTLYRHFRSKDDLVLAFLQRREQLWTREFVEAEARRRGATPRERLLAIFDVLDEWFHREDFEGCSFINVLLETGGLRNPVGRASAAHLEYIRFVVCKLAEEADVPDPEDFARSWHILMKGAIVAACEGDTGAAQRARAIGEGMLEKALRPRLHDSDEMDARVPPSPTGDRSFS